MKLYAVIQCTCDQVQVDDLVIRTRGGYAEIMRVTEVTENEKDKARMVAKGIFISDGEDARFDYVKTRRIQLCRPTLPEVQKSV